MEKPGIFATPVSIRVRSPAACRLFCFRADEHVHDRPGGHGLQPLADRHRSSGLYQLTSCGFGLDHDALARQNHVFRHWASNSVPNSEKSPAAAVQDLGESRGSEDSQAVRAGSREPRAAHFRRRIPML